MAFNKRRFVPNWELIFQESIATNKLFTVKIFSFVLACNYISLSNIWACLHAQQLSAAVIAQANYLCWKPEYTSFPALCTRNIQYLAFLPLGSRNNSKLPGKMIPVLERGRWRKHLLWHSPSRQRALPCPGLSPAESQTRCAHRHWARSPTRTAQGLCPNSEKTLLQFLSEAWAVLTS